MRTTTGPAPAERTKMSAPAGLWTIWDLKMEGSADWAAATFAKAKAIANAIRLLDMIPERRPIHFSFAMCGVSITITSAGSGTTLIGDSNGECKGRGENESARLLE